MRFDTPITISRDDGLRVIQALLEARSKAIDAKDGALVIRLQDAVELLRSRYAVGGPPAGPDSGKEAMSGTDKT